jgi:hypothetical protein
VSKNLSKPGQCQITLPKQTFDYLTYLASVGKGGSSVPEVAAYILVEVLNQRLADGWHKPEVPMPVAQGSFAGAE